MTHQFGKLTKHKEKKYKNKTEDIKRSNGTGLNEKKRTKHDKRTKNMVSIGKNVRSWSAHFKL